MHSCVYHPTEEMRVVDEEEFERLLATGYWFKHPNEAKKMREEYERQINEKHGRKSRIKQRVCEENTNEPCIDERERPTS